MSQEQASPESEPATVESTEQDLNALSEDQLKEMIDNPQAELPLDDPEPEHAEEQVAEAPESASDVAEPEPDPEPEPEAEEDRLSKLEAMFQKSELQREAETARNEQLKYELDRRSGELGHLKGQLQQQQAAPQPQPEQAYDYTPESAPQQNVEPLLRTVRGEIDQMRMERTNTEATQELARAQAESAPFWNSLGDDRVEFEKTWNSKFSQELQGMGLTEAASSGDSKRAKSIVGAAYKAALADSRLEWLDRTLEERRSAPPPTNNKNEKLAAAAGAGGSRRPAVRPKPKALGELSAEELKAEIDRRDLHGIDVR